MGNYIEKSLLGSNVDAAEEKTQRDDSETINYRIFQYKQYIPLKDRRLLKWARAKLLLTGQLIRANQHLTRFVELKDYNDIEELLREDELYEDICEQLSSLENYRKQLLHLINLIARHNTLQKAKRNTCKAACLKKQIT